MFYEIEIETWLDRLEAEGFHDVLSDFERKNRWLIRSMRRYELWRLADYLQVPYPKGATRTQMLAVFDGLFDCSAIT